MLANIPREGPCDFVLHVAGNYGISHRLQGLGFQGLQGCEFLVTWSPAPSTKRHRESGHADSHDVSHWLRFWESWVPVPFSPVPKYQSISKQMESYLRSLAKPSGLAQPWLGESLL